jgi:hypothetical protein
VPRYVLVDEDEVDPRVVAMADDVLRRALAELDLGATPRIQWFADTRELPASRVAAATEVYVPEDGVDKAGSVPPFVRFTATGGWEPSPPIIMLSRSQCLPDTPLHELRHLWQIKQGLYRADEVSTPEIEADADDWAAGAMARLRR